jgi:hypothetical protein
VGTRGVQNQKGLLYISSQLSYPLSKRICSSNHRDYIYRLIPKRDLSRTFYHVQGDSIARRKIPD